ncbi:MAG: hypothetical protein IPO42_10820 [Chitinophagaceae bacterium]|nr:hypothetical protein [Chitinophagaceae bacterium]
MKKAIFLCLFVFLTSSLLLGQQIKLTNKTLSDKNSRTLYIGVNNEFEIQCETLKGIFPQNGVLLDQNKLSIRPTTVGKLTIVILTKDGENPISFDVRRVPDPMPVVEGESTREIFKNSLSSQSQLSLRASNSDDTFFDNYKIVSFQATLNGTNYEITGDSFSPELKSAIIKAKNDDTLAISDVKGFNDEINKSININGSFSFKIK